MRDDWFEWDDDKAASNFRDHQVTFETARKAFGDPDNIDRDDPDPHEERLSRLCRLDLRIFVIILTESDSRIRIISARRANKHEQRTYFEQ